MLSEQQQRIMGYFIEEAKDHLNTIEQGLLNLQATIADPEMVNEVFRAAHSVKGGAAMLGLTSIQNTSHRLEDYFKVLKDCPIQIDQKLETLLLRVYDTLQELLEQLQGPFGLTDDKAEVSMAAVEPTFTELNQHLSQLVSQAGVQTPEDVDLAVATPASTVSKPAPVRATTEESALRFIFQNDVPARLREMLQLFKQADTLETRQQLQTLCQTLAQSGEQLDLSDWCQLLNTAERAITNADNTYRTLAPVVIKEIKRAQEQILTGNGVQITASADLLALVPPEPLPTVAEVTGTDLADFLGVTDGSDGFDLFSEELALGELTSAERVSDASEGFPDLSASPEAAFETNESEFELSFDAFAAEDNASNAPDLSFIEQFDEAIPALANHQAGPEVGVAELNSLADLFEGENSDLGLAWQEVVDESGESEPEALELDSSSDFSDLLFQDSDVLKIDEPEEDLSGLLNKSAQQVDAELNTDAFSFGEPTDLNLDDSLGDLDLAASDQAGFDSELIFSDFPSSTEPAFLQSVEPNFETELFGTETSEASDPTNLDVLFSSEEDSNSAQEDNGLGSISFDALFEDEVRNSSVDDGLTDGFDFNAELDAEGSPELALDADLDALEPSNLDADLDNLDLGLSAPDSGLDLSDLNSDIDIAPLLDDTGSLIEESLDEPDLLPEPLDFAVDTSLGSPELDLDALGSLESSDAAASSPSLDADLGFSPPAIADPWSEGLESSQPNAISATDAALDAVVVNDEPAAAENRFSEAEESALLEVSWMDLDLSEPANPIDLLNSDLPAEPELTFVDPAEPFDVPSFDSDELNDELNGAELDFQAVDSSTLEALNQPSLELTADEAANLDFNFDEAAFDETAFSLSIDSPTETSSAFDVSTNDATALDFEVSELAAPVDSEENDEEVPFHFGALADAATDGSADTSEVGLDDLIDESDVGDLELDLFEESEFEASETEPRLAASTSDADLSLDTNFNADFDFAGSENVAENVEQNPIAVDLQTDASSDFDLFSADNLEDSEIDAILLTGAMADETADVGLDVGLSDLSPLDDLNLDLDEFALPDDFSEVDSTISSDSADSSETIAEEPILAELSELDTADELNTADVADPTLEAAIPEATLGWDAAFVESPLPDSVESAVLENPLDDRTLEALFASESESEPPTVAADDLSDLDLFDEVEIIEPNAVDVTPPEVELNLDQSLDLGFFDPELSSEALSAPELPPLPEASDLSENLLDSSFDLFAAEEANSEASGAGIFSAEADLADDLDLETELIVPDDTGAELALEEALSLEDLEFEDFETHDFNADSSTEQALDAAFSVEGIEDENLLEFVPDARTDSVAEDNWAEIELDSTAVDTPEVVASETTEGFTAEPPDQLPDDLFAGELSDELSDDLSLALEMSVPEVEAAESEPTESEFTAINADLLSNEFSEETDDLNFSESADPPDELSFGADLFGFDPTNPELNEVNLTDAASADELFNAALENETSDESDDLTELNFEQDFGGLSFPEEIDAATLDFNLPSDLESSDSSADLGIELPEVEPLEMEASEATLGIEAGDELELTVDLNSADLNSELASNLDLELDSDFSLINFDADSTSDLVEQESISFDSEQDLGDLDWNVDSSLDTETAPSINLIEEGDLNDLDLDGLLEETASSSDSLLEPSLEPSLIDDSEVDTEIFEAAESFDSSLSQVEFGDLDALLAESSSSVELGTVSAEPAEFDDLEAMLAEEPLPITAIHVEEDLAEAEPEIPAISDASELEAADDFADLEALLDDSSEAEPVELAPVTSLVEVDDEFSDLEALLQDADQALGGGSSPTRKASTTANRRPSRRSGLSEQTMRVSVKHLDNLNNLVGEMVVNRNSLEQAEERLRQFLDNLLYQVQQLSDVGQRMRDLYERSLLESSLLSGRRGSTSTSVSGFGSGGQPNHAAGMNFDALEMDRFTGFHVLSQEMIELIVRVRESASDIDFVVEETDQVTRNFRQITTQLQEGLTRSRMVPFSQTADRLPRGVRDNSLKYGKQAELVIEGRDTLIDKMIVEQLYDPMTHLVNNAIAHGIETPEERIAAGKPPTGKIVIRTFHQGNQTVISVGDDGAGINPENVRAKALAKGIISATQAQEMSRLDTYDLLFQHGFSTVDHIDDLRGRGVGLDVVRNNLNEIRGTINIDSTIGKGTTFTIRLPLTLSISKALCCISHRARIAFPMDGVEDMLDVPKERIQTDEHGRPCIQWRDVVLPFQPLSDLLRYNRVLGRGSVYGGNQEEDVISIVVLRSAGNFLALQVDQVLGEQEIVIKQLEGPVPKPLGVAGATVLGDGRIMPIADVLELIDLWQGRIRREAGGLLWDKGEAQLPPEPPAKTEPTVLIVDDSITVRELLSMTFSKVGYRVEQARDGQEAWEKLRAGLPCDLVFCDIEMPRMDGLELLSRIQKDSNLSHLPIAMLTSRGADRHRQMAVQLGAKGYFTKPYLEEVLLDAAQRMLKGEVMISGVSTQ
ncbi:MAG: response regulator [Cyanobacteria bacterium RM1_2_2]|nr:response regulator [Cyanobacteria bacterium RM1_2_2]